MLKKIISYSLTNKLIVFVSVFTLIGFGIYSLLNIPIGAVPDITNNQVQVITTSRDLPTEEVERFLTYPVELEMANLPGVQEIRSVSKFGLSVVTIVFDDNMGTYLPRQMIAEKLSVLKDEIPEGFGTPFMGPISTGLGEIYQYILDVKPGYEDRYTVTDLRTIQDWIVKRQLSGIPGIVEVNTWGGYLKTFEVAVNPSLLNAMEISLEEVYSSIYDNNSVAGGGYIEKNSEAFFIRGDGLLKDKADLENVLVTHKGNTPVLLKDIATIQLGHATRFGAITGNGEGEKVLGQVMMLKGANSKEVIDNVIDRVEEIQSSLPEGVFINPFLERSELIGRTTFTIAENLILGFLIVFFVVMFLLGNLRSGLVVASVIPLSLLFALSMMYLFGVDANLMSLGAIDFGIIIDGAVIIIEYLAYSITKNQLRLKDLQGEDRQKALDKTVLEGVNKMMHSAVFGQIIIIIVFIPILVLSGVEGKMFKPMALTFIFALIGTMLLCFTYVPVMAALFLKPQANKSTVSSRFIEKIKSWYTPLLSKGLDNKVAILSLSGLLLIITGFLFTRMGGEFVPTLDEGDFVVQPVLKTGMSLDETVKMTTRIEKILLEFPEVKQVVSRIGAAEVPTDPMSMEESDVIITLHKKSTWKTADSKDGLADAFKAALESNIPNVEIEFTQPIEMRFNELISGARADLAIKLFGEDLDVLFNKANEIEKIIEGVEGAADISVEKIDGLPQMSVTYDHQKLAKYGVSVSTLNDLISMGFAGKKAGAIFEGERQFDIVLKYGKDYRNSIEDLQKLWVSLPDGSQLPLEEFAKIEYANGPAKISRDDTKRRVVVGVNVRGRDLQSVVDEVSGIVESKITLPSGYYIQYGGQFENLQKATQRLLIAVPIALFLIFILLYFAFDSTRDALLIYSAIPLAAIGGVLALYTRSMPFSISAGVGFIALFGIAVLNGIVLIEHFKELRKHTSDMSIKELIIHGATDRIRPVLLTAMAAALGFLPMAISTSAGAEVQRPLATVVIGGLITSTFLTLFVLPILYSLFGFKKSKKRKLKSLVLLPLVFMMFSANGQEISNANDVLELIPSNIDVYDAQVRAQQQRLLIDGSRKINPTDVFYEYDFNNIAENGSPLHVIGIGHEFKLPSVHANAKMYQSSLAELSDYQKQLVAASKEKEVLLLFESLQYSTAVYQVNVEYDSLYQVIFTLTKRKNELGSLTKLEELTAQQKWKSQSYSTLELKKEIQALKQQLKVLISYDQLSLNQDYRPLLLNRKEYNILNDYLDARINVENASLKQNQNGSKPTINLSLFNGMNSFSDKLYPGGGIGLSLPLFTKEYKIQKQVDQLSIDRVNWLKERQSSIYNAKQKSLLIQLEEMEEMMDSYSEVLEVSTELQDAAGKSFNQGQIDFLDYLRIVEEGYQSRLKQLELLYKRNQLYIQSTYYFID